MPRRTASGSNPMPDQHGERTGRVDRVVAPGNAERAREICALPGQGERHRAVCHDRVNTHIGGGVLPEGQDALAVEARGDRQRLPGRRSRPRRARPHPRRTATNASSNASLRAVVVEVIGVDVRDERDRGVVEQEGAVGLVGLDDEQVAGAPVRADAERLDDPAVDEARILLELDQRGDDHAGRRWSCRARPATAISRCRRISQASAWERWSTGMPRSTAARYSGLSGHSAPV